MAADTVNIALQSFSLSVVGIVGYVAYQSYHKRPVSDPRLIMKVYDNDFWKPIADKIFEEAKIGHLLDHTLLTEVRLDDSNKPMWYWNKVNTRVPFSAVDYKSYGTPSEQLDKVTEFILSYGN